MTVSTRPEEPRIDEPFVRRLVLETIAFELGAQAWPQPMRDHLLEIQYTGRRHAARGSYPEGDSLIVLADGVSAGWMFTATLEQAVWVSEIMVLPEWRGKGVGTAALSAVIARAGDKPVRLAVNMTNIGAIRLYERLGFRRAGGNELQHIMEYRR
jgi:GNAT superfamily N-acetyltransferase